MQHRASGWIRPFQKKLGRDGTQKLFWAYIKDMCLIVLVPIVAYFILDALNALMTALMAMIIETGFLLYARLSLRIRRLEERTECQRFI